MERNPQKSKTPFYKGDNFNLPQKQAYFLITLYECLYSLMEHGRQKSVKRLSSPPIQKCTKPTKRSIHAGFRREQAPTLCKPVYNFLYFTRFHHIYKTGVADESRDVSSKIQTRRAQRGRNIG